MNTSSEATEVREPSPADAPQPLVDESPEGVDRTLIHHMLSLSPADRLRMLQGFASSVWALRNGRRPRA